MDQLPDFNLRFSPELQASFELSKSMQLRFSKLLRDETLSPQEKAEQILQYCEHALEDAHGKSPTGPGEPGDTPGLEAFLGILWSELLNAVKDTNEHHSHLVEVVKILKRSDHASLNWRVWGTETTWSKLPCLGMEIREDFNGTHFEP
jgi:hypothetical protein